MLNFRRLWLVTGLGVALSFGSIRSSLAAGRQFLHGHVPEAVAHLQPTGRFPGTNHLNLAIGLPLRNEAALDDLLRQIYDPASPNYRRYLTPEQFGERVRVQSVADPPCRFAEENERDEDADKDRCRNRQYTHEEIARHP